MTKIVQEQRRLFLEWSSLLISPFFVNNFFFYKNIFIGFKHLRLSSFSNFLNSFYSFSAWTFFKLLNNTGFFLRYLYESCFKKHINQFFLK